MKGETPMLLLRETRTDELADIHALETRGDVAPFVHGYSLERHARALAEPGMVYLTILITPERTFGGYVILALHEDHVELRRVALKETNQGHGTHALNLLETYCRDELGHRRIRLDVFETNHRGIHLYEKLGYQLLRAGVGADCLRIYEKAL